MDPEKFREAYQKLQGLEQRSDYKIRPPSGGGMIRSSVEQVEKRLFDLANYTLELKEIVDELFQAIAATPRSPTPPRSPPKAGV